jgi:hypothetical protein
MAVQLGGNFRELILQCAPTSECPTRALPLGRVLERISWRQVKTP